MVDEQEILSILRTKLYRPPVADDIIQRPHLIDALNRGRHKPLTLISAPAGYGKSTLVSNWVKSLDKPSAWFSLDEHDNNLHRFILHMISAIQPLFEMPSFSTQDLLTTASLPPLTSLTHALLNDLNSLPQPLIFVLDDYHMIHDLSIHHLMEQWLRHPPRNVHLVILTRIDPPLPLHLLRARSQMTEIRTRALRLDREEASTFLAQILRLSIDKSKVQSLSDIAEGWVAGLRLIALSIEHGVNADHLLQKRPEIANLLYIADYFLSEVFNQQPEIIQHCLLQISIFDRFCPSLIEFILEVELKESASALNIQDFIFAMIRNESFIIPLDEQSRWYRYHHLFKSFLQKQLDNRYSPHIRLDLYRQASHWFADNGLIDESLNYALLGQDMDMAQRLFAQYRHMLMNQEQWHQLARWIQMFPQEAVQTIPELILSQAWLCQVQFRYTELEALLTQATTLLTKRSERAPDTRHLLGEIAALRTTLYYFLEGDAQQVIANGERALECLPSEQYHARSIALLMLSGAHQLRGNLDKTFAIINQAQHALSLPLARIFSARMLWARCFAHWQAADLKRMQASTEELFGLSETHRLNESLSFARSFLGSIFYHQNDLDAAEDALRPLIENRHIANVHCFAHGAFALALTYQAQGNDDQARETARLPLKYAHETHHTFLLPMVIAFQAELALRQGRLLDAMQWTEQHDAFPLLPMPRFYVPQLTEIKVYLAQNTVDSQQQAATLLSRLEAYAAGIHNVRVLIEVFALKAILDHVQGHDASALQHVMRAVDLAQDSGFIRLFVDLGSNMAHLLGRLQPSTAVAPYVAQIISAFRLAPGGSALAVVTPSPSHIEETLTPQRDGLAVDHLLNPLTNRELEILELLAQRLSNQEIADRLYLATETVRKHTSNIYRKLYVNNRRQAVDKAVLLNILPFHEKR